MPSVRAAQGTCGKYTDPQGTFACQTDPIQEISEVLSRKSWMQRARCTWIKEVIDDLCGSHRGAVDHFMKCFGLSQGGDAVGSDLALSSKTLERGHNQVQNNVDIERVVRRVHRDLVVE